MRPSGGLVRPFTLADAVLHRKEVLPQRLATSSIQGLQRSPRRDPWTPDHIHLGREKVGLDELGNMLEGACQGRVELVEGFGGGAEVESFAEAALRRERIFLPLGRSGDPFVPRSHPPRRATGSHQFDTPLAFARVLLDRRGDGVAKASCLASVGNAAAGSVNAWPIVSLSPSLRTCASTRRTRSTGGSGGPAPWPRPSGSTGRSC